MKDFFANKYVKWTLGVLGVLSVLVLIVGSYFNIMFVDSAILLVEMERIAEGYIPYETLHLNYPPLWFYINVALKKLFHVPYGCYHFYLTIHWLYAIGCATCLYYISKKWSANNYISVFVVWLFFMLTQWRFGNFIIFEIPSVFWGLLAVSLFLKWENRKPAWQIIVGVFSCCAFLTKQFGAGFLLLVLWLILTSASSNKWKQAGYYLLGYCIPLLICLACWGTNMYQSILFNGYGTDAMVAYLGIKHSKLVNILKNLFNFLNYSVPFVYVAIILLPTIFKQNQWREGLFCFFGIGGFLLQFYFAIGDGNHYFLYMIPFALLLIPIILTLDLQKYVQGVMWAAIALTVAFGFYTAYYNRVWKYYLRGAKQDYENQWKMGEQISNIVQEGETVFIPHVLQFAYYTANLYPSCMAEIGYGCGPMEMTIAKTAKCVSEADYVLHFTHQFRRSQLPESWKGKDYEYTDSIQQYVDQFPSDTFGTTVVLHYLNRPKLKQSVE